MFTNDNSLRECLLCESELTLARAISAGHASKETPKHGCKILKSNETTDLHKTSKHSKSRGQTSAQATELIKKIQVFVKTLASMANAPSMEKFGINVIGKTILRNAVYIIEKLSTKLNKLKLSHLLMNTNFSLMQ